MHGIRTVRLLRGVWKPENPRIEHEGVTNLLDFANAHTRPDQYGVIPIDERMASISDSRMEWSLIP